MLATFSVTNLSDGPVTAADDQPGSLRQAIFDANAAPGADTITFDPNVFTGGDNSLIRLNSGDLLITDTLTIDASGLTDNVTINAQQNSRVLNFSSTSGDLMLNSLTLTGGRTTGDNSNSSDSTFNGGGIRFLSDGALTLTSSTVSGNSTAGEFANGGGIYARFGAVALASSTVSGNSTTGRFADGGGIRTFAGAVTLTSSTVSGNSTTGGFADGGGIFTGSGAVTITSSTVTGNSTLAASSQGGGVFVDNSASSPAIIIENSIIAGNTDNGMAPDLRPGLTSPQTINHSLIGNTTGARINGNTGTGNLLNTNPLLGVLADNGGPTFTHALLAGSPAINAGSSTETFDQRGFARPALGAVDIGAFELQENDLVVSTTIDVIDGDFSTGNLSLREAINLANARPGADTIEFDPGVFGVPQTIGLNSQLPTIPTSLTITGPGADLLTLDAGDGENANILGDGFRIFDIDNSDSGDIVDVVIIGLTLTGGDVNSNGGAIRTAENLTLTSSIVRDNHSGDDGGGIFNVGGATLAVIDSTITGNSATDDGGGISNYGTTQVLRSTISGNQSVGGNNSGGGGILTRGSGTLTVTDSTLSNNSSDDVGGGIFSFGGLTNVTNSTISGNLRGCSITAI